MGGHRGTVTGREVYLQTTVSTFLLEFHFSGGVKDRESYFLSRRFDRIQKERDDDKILSSILNRLS